MANYLIIFCWFCFCYWHNDCFMEQHSVCVHIQKGKNTDLWEGEVQASTVLLPLLGKAMSWCRMLVRRTCITLYPITVISHLVIEVNIMRFYLHSILRYVCHRLNCTLNNFFVPFMPVLTFQYWTVIFPLLKTVPNDEAEIVVELQKWKKNTAQS